MFTLDLSDDAEGASCGTFPPPVHTGECWMTAGRSVVVARSAMPSVSVTSAIG